MGVCHDMSRAVFELVLYSRTLFTAAIAAVMSTCDSVKTVLSGAVFTLINASAALKILENSQI